MCNLKPQEWLQNKQILVFGEHKHLLYESYHINYIKYNNKIKLLLIYLVVFNWLRRFF
jgi:hypothetical protein